MYVACKAMLVSGGRRVTIGDPLPEALTWHRNVLIAHLNLKWIKWVDAEENDEISVSSSELKNPEEKKATKRSSKVKTSKTKTKEA